MSAGSPRQTDQSQATPPPGTPADADSAAGRPDPLAGARSPDLGDDRRAVPTGIAANIARMNSSPLDEPRPVVRERASARSILRCLAILALPATIAGAVSLFVVSGLRSEALRGGFDATPAPVAGRVAAPPASEPGAGLEAEVLASSRQRRAEEEVHVAELETRRADLARTVEELADAEQPPRQVLAELETRRADLVRTVEGLEDAEQNRREELAELAGAEQPRRQVLAELETRRVDLARTVEGLADAERQQRQTLAELADAEAPQRQVLAELETRRADLARTVEGLADAERQQREGLAGLADNDRQQRQALAELETRRADLARNVDGLAGTERDGSEGPAELDDAEGQRSQALDELESRWADLARTVDDMAEVERQRRQTLAELEGRQASLARAIEDMAAAERDERLSLAELTARRQAEAQEVAELERRREVLAATTMQLDARQQSLTRSLLERERDASQTPTRLSPESLGPADVLLGATEEPVPDDSVSEGGQRVFVHYSDLEPGAEALADQVARDLIDRGVAVADIRAVGFGIGANRVRYFFGDEATAAPTIGAMVASSLGFRGDAYPEIQDFTHFEPKPSLGTIEIWVTRTEG